MSPLLPLHSRAPASGNELLRPLKMLKSGLLSATILAGPVAFGATLGMGATALLAPAPAFAQQVRQTNPDAELLLTADELVYDNDNEIVTAKGNVQLDYDGHNVVADRVSYNQKTRRVKAFGNVEILEPNGNRIYAQEIDLTDDFGEGFVNALRVETPDNTRVAAESAERFADQKTVFHHGVYTACEPCKEKPDRPPIWQVKAQKVILDGVEKTVTYRHARFELFGLPIAYFPYFSHPDPSVKRKSGFLIPRAGYRDQFGYWYKQRYFLVTGDSHDLTFSGTGLEKQGFLGEVEWRQKFDNGSYFIKVAGIKQQSPEEFNINTSDREETDRGMIGTRGDFNINSKWAFGWNALIQSDNNFSRTYRIKNFTASEFTNRAYLQGLHDRSFFNLSAKQYLVQNSSLIDTGNAFLFDSEQPIVRPVLDYNYVKTDEFTGGELSLDVNVTSIERGNLSSVNSLATIASGDFRTPGIEGDTTRASADLGWKKTITTNAGVNFTPSLSLRGDWTTTDGISLVPTAANPDITAVTNGTYTRFMPTAGLEVSYAILAKAAGSSHVFEPTAQIFLRPDLGFDGVAPNEDSQSLVFDATTLFERDKFSGYDRIESGTRANIGVRYSGQFANGWSLSGLVGQSFHLAGENPYAREDDLVNAGEASGLETDRSDYVASLSLLTNAGLSFNSQARFDSDNFSVERAEVAARYGNSLFNTSVNYTFIAAQPDYSFDKDRQQIGLSSSLNITDNWRVFGAAQYDLETDVLISNNIGLAYHDECFTFSLSFNESRARSGNTEVGRSLSFNIGIRTIGDYQIALSEKEFEDLTSGEGF